MSDAPSQEPDLGAGAAAPGAEEVDSGSQPNPVDQEPTYDYLEIDDDLAGKYVRLPVDGEEVSVPLNEALQGYQRQADYTRKTQELAEQRREAENAIQLQRALQTNPGMTVQILAQQAGMGVEEFLGLTPAQQQQAVQDGQSDEYVDPLERALMEERAAREALEQRIYQREADETLRSAVNGLKQQFQIDDDQAREVVAFAYHNKLPPQMFPMIYQSMAFQKMTAKQQAQQEHQTAKQQEDQRRQAAAQAANGVIGTGQSANGVQGTPANQEFTNYRDAIMAAFEQVGDVA